jgi:hypothetical protein
VVGLTYNFENPDTDYKNGIDSHLDWAASQFLNEHVHVGVVGYFFQQLTGDSGAGATAGDFKSRVAGIGPQIGFLFPVGDSVQGYANLKGYKEFAAEHRAEGWRGNPHDTHRCGWCRPSLSRLRPRPRCSARRSVGSRPRRRCPRCR